MAESSSHQDQPSSSDIPKPVLPTSVEEKRKIIQKFLSPEPMANLDSYGYSGLDEIYSAVNDAVGFQRMIQYSPRYWLPQQVATFFLSFCSGDESDPQSATFMLQRPTSNEPIPILSLICKIYEIPDAGEIDLIISKPSGVLLDISNEDLQTVYQKALMQPAKSYDGKRFVRPALRPEYRALFDLVHKVFLGYHGNHDAVTPAKFRIIAAIVQKLSVNWARLLLALLKEEVKQISQVVDESGQLVEFKVSKKLRLSTKICSLIHGISAGSNQELRWSGRTPFTAGLLPKDKKQLELILGVDHSIFAKYAESVQSFLYAMGRSNPEWVPPAQKGQKKRLLPAGLSLGKSAKSARLKSPTPARSVSADVAEPAEELAEGPAAETAVLSPSAKRQLTFAEPFSPSYSEEIDEEIEAEPVVSTGQDSELPSSLVLEPVSQTDNAAPSPPSNLPPLDSGLVFSDDEADIPFDPAQSAAQAYMSNLQSEATHYVKAFLPGIDLTPQARDNAFKLHALLAIKDGYFCDLKSVFLVRSLDELEVEEHELGQFFGFHSIPEARRCFKQLVLTKMKVEAKFTNVDLKPYYQDNRELYNQQYLNDSFSFTPIQSPSRSEEPESGPGRELIPTSDIGSSQTSLESDLKSYIEKQIASLRSDQSKAVEEMKTASNLLVSNLKQEYANLVKEAVKNQFASFIEKKLKDETDKLLPSQLANLNVAFTSTTSSISEDVKLLSSQVETLATQVSNILESCPKQIETLQGSINSLLQFKEKISADVSKLQAEQASHYTLLQERASVDNAEKGESGEAGRKGAEKADMERGKGKKKQTAAKKQAAAAAASAASKEQVPNAVQSVNLTKSGTAKHSAPQSAPPSASQPSMSTDQAILLRLMQEAGLSPEDCADKEKQEAFLADLRKQRIKDRAIYQLLKFLSPCPEQASSRPPVDWLPASERQIWNDFFNQFIFHHYWLKLDPRFNVDTVYSWLNWVKHFPEQGFISRVKDAAASAKVRVAAPMIETFSPPIIQGTSTPDFNKINIIVRSLATHLGFQYSNSPEFKSVRECVYASLGLVSKAKIAEEKTQAEAK